MATRKKPLNPQCTARSKRSGEQCKNRALDGRTTCRMHGGKTPVGPASPAWKTGEHSKFVPDHLLASFEKAVVDPALIQAREDIALNRAVRDEILDQMNTGAVAAVLRIREVWTEYKAAIRAQDWSKLMVLESAMDEAVNTAANYDVAVDKLLTVQEMGRRLRETEARTLKTAAEVIRADEQVALIRWMVGVLEEVVEPKQLVDFTIRLHNRLGKPLPESDGEIVVDGG